MWCHLKLRKSWHKFKTNLIILMWTSSDLNECSILLAYFGTSLLLSHYGNMTRLSLLFNGNHLVFVFFFIFIYNGQKSCAICARLGILLMSLAIVKKKRRSQVFYYFSSPIPSSCLGGGCNLVALFNNQSIILWLFFKQSFMLWILLFLLKFFNTSHPHLQFQCKIASVSEMVVINGYGD